MVVPTYKANWATCMKIVSKCRLGVSGSIQISRQGRISRNNVPSFCFVPLEFEDQYDYGKRCHTPGKNLHR